MRKYYLYLATDILLWGIVPLLTVYFYSFYSAAVFTALSALISAVSFTAIAWKKLRLLNRRYFLVAISTGVCYSLATILQMIGLQYTTPSMFAFLENTDCIVVPVLLFVLFRKKPHPLMLFAGIICLAGCFILSGMRPGASIGIGEILCALAGLLFSGNIVGTGTYAKDMHVSLYLMIQKWVHLILSVLVMLLLHFLRVDGQALEPMQLLWVPLPMLNLAVYVLISNTICWLLRTEAIQHIDMTLVSAAMPLSAVITMVLSVLVGTDTLSYSLVIGALLIFTAIILSGIGDALRQKQES